MPAHPEAPNFLFIFPDQWRWDWLGCERYGIPVRTPHLDALAARGVRFTQCRTNAPLSAPARASLVTGLRPGRCGVIDNGQDLDPSSLTYLQLLRNTGYRVAACGKTDLQKHGRWKGLDGWTRAMGQLGFTEAVNQAGKHDAVNSGTTRASDPYMAFLHRSGKAAVHADDYRRRKALRGQYPQHRPDEWVDPSPSPLTSDYHTDDFCGRAALSFLERWEIGEPWHLWVNFPGPHEPFDPTTEQLAAYDGVQFPSPIQPGPVPNDHQAIRRAYAAMITGIDTWVGRLIAQVTRRGELDNTWIIFSSDHGEMLGDHGRWHKGVAYEPSVHVPLIMAGPQAPPGRICPALIELMDLAPTLTELARLKSPAAWQARSFLAQLRGEVDRPHRAFQIAELHDWRMICDGRYKLISTREKPDQLFDLQADPCELTNIAAAHPQIVAGLTQQFANGAD